MRAAIILFVATLFAASSIIPTRVESQTKPPAQPQPATQPREIEQEFLRREQEWMDAAQKRYGKTLDRIISNDFVMTNSVLPAERINKVKFIAESLRPGNRLDSFTFDHLVVQSVGDVVIVNALCTQKASLRGIDMSGDYYLTDVWVKRGNEWQVVGRNLVRARPASGPGRNVAGNAGRNNQNLRANPCVQACRRKYSEDANTRCLVKSVEEGEPVSSYEPGCMRVAKEALDLCTAECKKESKPVPAN